MNAAFLVVTTMWLAGAEGTQAKPTTPPPAPITSVAPIATGCCDACAPACCEEKPSLLARLKARLRKDECCETVITGTCGCAAPVASACCNPCERLHSGQAWSVHQVQGFVPSESGALLRYVQYALVATGGCSAVTIPAVNTPATPKLETIPQTPLKEGGPAKLPSGPGKVSLPQSVDITPTSGPSPF